MTVRTDRVVADVRVAPGARWSTPAVAARVRQAFPLVVRHACVNDADDTFDAVLDSTPLPHVLEHLVIDIQTRAHAEREDEAIDPVFTGTTQWSATMRDVAIVRVSFYDDLIALGAFKQALHFINQELA